MTPKQEYLQFLKNKTDLLKHVNIRSRILDPAILYLSCSDESIPGTSTCKKRCGLSEEIKHTAEEDAKDIVLLVRNKLKDIFIK